MNYQFLSYNTYRLPGKLVRDVGCTLPAMPDKLPSCRGRPALNNLLGLIFVWIQDKYVTADVCDAAGSSVIK